MIGAALLNLADIAACLSGDFHTMHLNIHGTEFDTLHRKVLTKYYVEADYDYDNWAETAMLFDDVENVPNKNKSAERIQWQSFEGDCTRDSIISRTTDIINGYIEALHTIFVSLNTKQDDYKCVGVANTLQTRIEYWSKEVNYFNARRY